MTPIVEMSPVQFVTREEAHGISWDYNLNREGYNKKAAGIGIPCGLIKVIGTNRLG